MRCNKPEARRPRFVAKRREKKRSYSSFTFSVKIERAINCHFEHDFDVHDVSISGLRGELQK